MKKIILMMCMMVIGVSTFAAVANYNPLNDGWNANLTDVTKIDEYIKKVQESSYDAKIDYRKKMWLQRLEFQKRTANMKFGVTPLADYKKVLDEFKNPSKNYIYIVLRNKNLQGFLPILIKENYFAINQGNMTMLLKFCDFDAFKNILSVIISGKVKLIDVKMAKLFLNGYKKFQMNFTAEENLKNLKAIKRMIYPNIAKSEDWKKVVVDLELMIKANE